ncbi:MAG TPA: NUDIX domain-containing protein [Acidimicrobiia bacterium]|jgi:8-oxo-dGTP pyrophosphatase MutT (NUDIX family)
MPAVFRVRVAGVAVHDGRVLFHRAAHDDFWALPGGRVAAGETLAEALVREIQEEVGVEAVAGPLLWVIENFFDHPSLLRSPPAGPPVAHHEIGHYLQLTLPPPLRAAGDFTGVEMRGTADEYVLEFSWFSVDELDGVDVRPRIVGDLLAEPLPAGMRTIVVSE